jgi:hypothetical protein
VEGVVTGVRGDSGHDIVLELDNGGELRLSDLVAAAPLDSTDSEGTSEV